MRLEQFRVWGSGLRVLGFEVRDCGVVFSCGFLGLGV